MPNKNGGPKIPEWLIALAILVNLFATGTGILAICEIARWVGGYR